MIACYIVRSVTVSQSLLVFQIEFKESVHSGLTDQTFRQPRKTSRLTFVVDGIGARSSPYRRSSGDMCSPDAGAVAVEPGTSAAPPPQPNHEAIIC